MSEKRYSTFSQLFPPKPKWTSADVPDQTGKTVIITGGNGGIGKETARALLSKGAKVYIAARSEDKTKQVIAELQQLTGKQSVFFLKLDLADLPSIKAAAAEFLTKESELHTLYNNGGIMTPSIELVTEQGYDAQFGTNVLGHFYFTNQLLPILIATARSSSPGTVRVVNVSSVGHTAAKGIEWKTLARGTESLTARRSLGPEALYNQSKLGNILFSNGLARRHGGDGIVSISLHPGGIKTDLMRNSGAVARAAAAVLLHDVSYGAITSLYAGTALPAAELNGKFLTAWARLALPSKEALDVDLEQRLWEWCEEQVRAI
ncbi:NAD-P-binding protein [Gloeopeniophorella convolvens]|nr:NAD-P-binding protein [Gloeopeniophorella convolvens]